MRKLLLMVLLGAAACSARTEDVLTSRPADDDFIDDGDGGDEDVIDELPADAETPNPSLCGIAGIALCDGFETPQVVSPPWFFVNYAASLTVDTQRFYRGNSALHVHTNEEPDAVQGIRMGELTETAVVPYPTLYGRVFMYVASPLPGTFFRTWGVLQEDAPNLGPSLFVQADGTLMATTSAVDIPSTTSMPLDRWVCLEWKVLSDVAGEMQVWLDGTEVADLHYLGDTTRNPVVNRFSMGAALFGDSQTRPPFDLWFDEIGLDDARIGCAR